MYGSSLRIETRRPRALRILPTLAAVMPLPRLLVTPPVTKTYFAMGRGSSGVFLMLSNPGPGGESPRGVRRVPWTREASARRPGTLGRVGQARAPDLGAAEVRVGRPRARWDRLERGRVRREGCDHAGQPRVDLRESGPAGEPPAGIEADPLEEPLGEHHIAVARRVPVALAVTDEHHPTTRGTVGEDPRAFARPADVALRMPVRERDRRALAGERGTGGDDGQFRHAEAREGRLDEEPEAIGHDLDRDASCLGPPHEGHEAVVVRLLRSRCEERRGVGADEVHLPRHQPAGPHLPGVIARRRLFPDARHVRRHDLVGDIGQRDGPVVVDEEGDRRRPGRERRHRRRGTDRRRPDRRGTDRRHAATALTRALLRRVRATPPTMIAPPTTWPRWIGSPRVRNARTTAIAGTSAWVVVIRGGPRRRAPLRTRMFERGAATG